MRTVLVPLVGSCDDTGSSGSWLESTSGTVSSSFPCSCISTSIASHFEFPASARGRRVVMVTPPKLPASNVIISGLRMRSGRSLLVLEGRKRRRSLRRRVRSSTDKTSRRNRNRRNIIGISSSLLLNNLLDTLEEQGT